MAIDHFILTVPEDKFKECVALYVKALEPLGYSIAHDYGQFVGFGSKLDSAGDAKVMADFWVAASAKETVKTHVAFRAPDRAAVDAFHAAAIANGGQDNGAPGVRERYHPNYYGAFVHDAAGNNIEVVNHNP